jgi:mannonate dehydratase
LKTLKETWRWFGPDDPVTLKDIRQTGAKGIVNALHHIPYGQIWPVQEIARRKQLIESQGLSWDVVESLTVHESIKTQTGDFKGYIEQYKQTLQNLAACGVYTVTYNFMPVIDWVRTNINYHLPDGAMAMYFDLADFALFDCFILKREGAKRSYSPTVIREATLRWQNYTEAKKQEITDNILSGIPSEESPSLPEIHQRLQTYRQISREQLRQHLIYFLQEICPLASALGIRLALHPDNPPFDIFGLPRVVSSKEDIAYILKKVNSEANGICFCTGSLGSVHTNNLEDILQMAGSRVHFVHLRNITKLEGGNFYESRHLEGDVDMFSILRTLNDIQQGSDYTIPLSPDLGHRILDDQHKTGNPGYTAIGRLKGLAELRGLLMGIQRYNALSG